MSWKWVKFLHCAATVKVRYSFIKSLEQERLFYEYLLLPREQQRVKMAAAATLEQTQWRVVEYAYPNLEHQAVEATRQFVGGIALASSVETEPVTEVVNDTTLLAGLQLAALGDEASRAMSRTNVETDVHERVFKAGDESEVELEFDSVGDLVQFGRPLTSIQRNTYETMPLNEDMGIRTFHESKNIFLLQMLKQHDLLKTHNAAVFSPIATNKETQKKYRMFMDTASCSVQLLSSNDNKAVLQTAMVAGKKTPESERHDLAAINKIITDNGGEYLSEDADNILRYVILIPKSATPNGITDLVRHYDEAVGGTFYGQDKPSQDYREYSAMCKRRRAEFGDMVEQITDQLISEAHLFKTPREAIERLDELSEYYCVRRAKDDYSIDVSVFGPTAAQFLEEARRYESMGQRDKANSALLNAIATADSSSCPFIRKKMEDDQAENKAELEGEDRYGSLTFKCPKKGCLNKRRPGKLIRHCQKCGADVMCK